MGEGATAMRGRPCTCCFTGHRPEKLPWGSDETDPRCAALKEKLRDAVEAAYGEGMRHFICGMARGCDLYFAEAVLALRAPDSSGGGRTFRQRRNHNDHPPDYGDSRCSL